MELHADSEAVDHIWHATQRGNTAEPTHRNAVSKYRPQNNQKTLSNRSKHGQWRITNFKLKFNVGLYL
jgi:hypothetical protein